MTRGKPRSPHQLLASNPIMIMATPAASRKILSESPIFFSIVHSQIRNIHRISGFAVIYPFLFFAPIKIDFFRSPASWPEPQNPGGRKNSGAPPKVPVAGMKTLCKNPDMG
jgi:hypothetical protein